MKVYAWSPATSLEDLGPVAKQVEELGYDGMSLGETASDVFIRLAIASQHTKKIKLLSDVAIVFPRSPMIVAYAAWEVHKLSGGRFELGIGTQVKGHIERRFSTEWSKPALRIKDYAKALHAIFDCWQNNTPLDYKGEFYSINLMNSLFKPPKSESGAPPPVFIGAIGPNMLRVAAEAADGVLLHPFITHKWVKEVTIPNLTKGASKAGKSLEDLEIEDMGFIVTGNTEDEVNSMREDLRIRMAFYATTRTYKPPLDLHGWGYVTDRLHDLSLKNQDFKAMAAEITDEMLDAFTVSGTYDEIAENIKSSGRFSHATRINFPFPRDKNFDVKKFSKVIDDLKSI
jgi:probable F420-dependent oxidoreductase